MATIPDGTAFANHGILVVETQDNTATHNWRNSIDMVWASGAMPVYGDPSITAFVNFMKGVQRADSTIIKVSMLPYVKGRQPLSAQGSLWEQVVSIACNCFGAGTAHPSFGSEGTATVGEVSVMYVKGKFGGGPGGRVGRMFLRNAVQQEALLPIAGGPPVLQGTFLADYPTDWNNWANSQLATFCEDNPLPRYCLIHSSKQGVPVGNHDIFDSAMAIPVYKTLTMVDTSKKNKK